LHENDYFFLLLFLSLRQFYSSPMHHFSCHAIDLPKLSCSCSSVRNEKRIFQFVSLEGFRYQLLQRGYTRHGFASLFDNVVLSWNHPSFALPLDDQTRVCYSGQPARSSPYSSRLPTAARSTRSAPRLAIPPPYTLPVKDSVLLLLPAKKKRSRFKAPRRGNGGGSRVDERGEYGGKKVAAIRKPSKTQKLPITLGLIAKG